MAKKDVLELFRRVQRQPQLMRDLHRVTTPEQLVETARGLGYQFTVDEWKAVTGFQVEELPGELSEIPGL